MLSRDRNGFQCEDNDNNKQHKMNVTPEKDVMTSANQAPGEYKFAPLVVQRFTCRTDQIPTDRASSFWGYVPTELWDIVDLDDFFPLDLWGICLWMTFGQCDISDIWILMFLPS